MSTPIDISMRQRFKRAEHVPSSAPSSSRVLAKPQPKPSRQPQLQPVIAFYVFLASHLVAAYFSPVQDCDEVFNYWEPTHYLTHGHGFQTWEYSPQYAIRSWAYTGLHAIVTLVGKLIPFTGGNKTAEFYLVRIVLGFVCALCEARLFSKISTALNPRIAITFLIIMATSPGMFHASIAFLPSSFAMYFVMLAMAAFMDWRGGVRTAQGVFCIGVGACLGWPFAAALGIPFMVEEFLLASMNATSGMTPLFWRVVDGIVRTLIVIGLQVCTDWFFYKQLHFVPFNIVLYNVLSGKSGPDLYGTEPWHFYLRNLALNFHVWVPISLAALPLLLVQHSTRAYGATKANYMRGIVFLSPFYLWLVTFTLQPHKEERFMYPAYPALALNAAVAFHIILANIGATDGKGMISRIPLQLRFLAIIGFVGFGLALSAFRIIGTMTAFGAPLSIYKPLHQPGMARAGDVVCLGKEWYRFPSHFLLPNGVNAKFIKSEFSGLLPGEFSEASHGFGLFPGTWLVPTGMNDENREDVGKYTDVRHCDFLVDSHLASTEPTKLEPSYATDHSTWERVQCLSFLDAASTGIIGRLGWIPEMTFVPARFRRSWGEYCLLKRKKRQAPRADASPRIETLQ